MSLDVNAAPSSIRLALATAGDEAGIAAAIELGNRARATLGHMPFAAYRDAAVKGTLLLAYDGDRLIGYALFGLTRNRVRLTHLCVARDRRGSGVARQMVDWISGRYADYPGIVARCRTSYQLGDMWIKLGFTQLSERPGRSKAGHVLVSWWRDHQHPNLFTRDADTVLVRAAIDLNVLRDLTQQDRTDTLEAQALIADHVTDRLELVRTAALDAEINQMTGALRGPCTQRAQQLTSPRRHADPIRLRQIEEDLTEAARKIEAGFPGSDQDRFDLDHVIEAVAVGVHVFATRDERLARILGPAALARGLRILRPADVVIHLDELARAEAYRPAGLLNTSYRRQLIGSGREDEVAELVNQAAGEKPRALVKAARDLALAGHDRLGIYTPDGELVALVAVKPIGTVLAVHLLRVANISLADTLARQLLFQLRQQARNQGATTIQISDRYLPTPAQLAVVNDGFRRHNGDYYALVVNCCGPADQVEHHAIVAARQAGLPEPASLRSGMPAVVAAELERIWWPAKLTDSKLPSYLIPIQQGFSANLLGVPQTLLPRHDSLGLAREHVYYRTPSRSPIQTPARLLWYMSSGGHGPAYYPSAVVACSRLDTVVTGEPTDLFERFQHLGVWDEIEVRGAARNGLVQALRFTDTELLAHVGLARLRRIADEHGQKGVPPQWPQPISSAMFAAVYEEGRQR